MAMCECKCYANVQPGSGAAQAGDTQEHASASASQIQSFKALPRILCPGCTRAGSSLVRASASLARPSASLARPSPGTAECGRGHEPIDSTPIQDGPGRSTGQARAGSFSGVSSAPVQLYTRGGEAEQAAAPPPQMSARGGEGMGAYSRPVCTHRLGDGARYGAGPADDAQHHAQPATGGLPLSGTAPAALDGASLLHGTAAPAKSLGDQSPLRKGGDVAPEKAGFGGAARALLSISSLLWGPKGLACRGLGQSCVAGPVDSSSRCSCSNGGAGVGALRQGEGRNSSACGTGGCETAHSRSSHNGPHGDSSPCQLPSAVTGTPASDASNAQSHFPLASLPPELLDGIMLRTPRVAWPAARAVCHSWRDTIGTPEFLRRRRAERLGENWAFMVEWMFRGSKETMGLLWAFDPAGPQRWYKLGCLPPMAGITHLSHMACYGPYAIFLGGMVMAPRPSVQTPHVPGRAVWRHNLLTGNTRRLPDLTQGRVGCASAVIGGKLVVAGGIGEGDVPLNTAEEFDPMLRKWVPLPSMRVTRRQCVGVVLNGRYWVFSHGGIAESQARSAEVYDPTARTWTLLEKMLPDNLGGRVATRFAVVNGRLLLTNHVSPVGHEVMVYDEASNIWTTVGYLPVGGYQGYGIFGIGSRLYIEGGVEPVTDPQLFAAALCGHNFLKKTPYVNVFNPFRPMPQQWEPNPCTQIVDGVPRRCQQCIVSCL